MCVCVCFGGVSNLIELSQEKSWISRVPQLAEIANMVGAVDKCYIEDPYDYGITILRLGRGLPNDFN